MHSTRAARGMTQSGMLILNCHPSFATPSGYQKHPALVDHCVLTDFIDD
ncbi:hypothetical protein [Streptomyces sp. NPDC051310]